MIISETVGQPIVKGNLTILQMMAEVDKLKQENENLRQARDHYKYNYELLHNKIVNEECTSSNNQENNYDDSQLADDENYELMTKAYAEADNDFKFAGFDCKIN